MHAVLVWIQPTGSQILGTLGIAEYSRQIAPFELPHACPPMRSCTAFVSSASSLSASTPEPITHASVRPDTNTASGRRNSTACWRGSDAGNPELPLPIGRYRTIPSPVHKATSTPKIASPGRRCDPVRMPSTPLACTCDHEVLEHREATVLHAEQLRFLCPRYSLPQCIREVTREMNRP